MKILKNEEFKLWDYEYELLEQCDRVEYDNYRLELRCYKNDNLIGDFGTSGYKRSMIYRYCGRNNKNICER